MANEIWTNYSEGNTLYAIIHKKTDDTVNIIGSNNFEAWQDANIDTYDLPMTDHDGDYYTVDFPTTITGKDSYRITIFKQLGASPDADDDIALAQGEFYWTGTKETDISTIQNSTNTTTTIENETATTPSIQVIVE